MVATKQKPLEKQQALREINTFFDKFKHCCNEAAQPKVNEFEKILAPNFQNITNGKVIGKNIQDFMKRINEVKGRFSHIEFGALKDCLICDNKAIVHYDMHVSQKDGKKVDFNIMAIATFEDNLIKEWTQVAHEKHKDHLGS